MGINKQVLKLLLVENEYKSLYGRILLIGRSSVNIRYDELSKLFNSFGIQPPSPTLLNKVTKNQGSGFCVDDIELFRSLSGAIERIDVLDISDYEGANITCDLNNPINDELHNQFDFIYDTSVLDNIFNPAQAIVNISKMLKPSGRYLGINVASFFPGALVSCHPEWFYSFFAANNYSDVKVYLTVQENPGESRFEYTTNLFNYKPTFTPCSNYDYFKACKSTSGICHSMVITEKQSSPSLLPIRYPVNLQYLESSKSFRWDACDFTASSQRVLRSSDTRILRTDSPPPAPPHLTDHYTYIGSGF